jgi:hypothetical protein
VRRRTRNATEADQMIVDDLRRVAFVHVPKCGGTTVKKQLAPFDSYQGHFERKGLHSNLGMIHYSHVPLYYLRAEFPVEFQKICEYRSFALLRDPHARFASATFQRLEEFGGVPALQITSALAIDEARKVIGWLGQRERFCDLEYIHFSRQADYVQLDGRQVVSETFPLENLAEFGESLEICFGMGFDFGRRENVNFSSLGGVFGKLRPLKPLYSRLTSWAFRERLLRLTHRWKSTASLYDRFRRDPEISAFVETYYAADFALRHEARLRIAAPPPR